MSDPPSAPHSPWSYAWVVIILAGVLTFAGGIWVRNWLNRPSELESIILENEPEDHVHSVTVMADGTTYIGTHLGVLTRKGREQWRPLAGTADDTQAALPDGQGGLLVAGRKSGVVRLREGKAEALLAGDVSALALDPGAPDHLIAFVSGAGLKESRDGGRNWTPLGNIEKARAAAIAFDPAAPGTLYVGGLGDLFLASTDGGRTWQSPGTLQGSITAFAFDPGSPGRLWAAIDGRLRHSDNRGTSWTQVTTPANSRPIVGLTFQPGRRDGPVAVTSGGYLFTYSP